MQRVNTTHISKGKWVLILSGLGALVLHTLQNYSFLQMDDEPRFVVDSLTIGLVAVVAIGFLLPVIRRVTLGDAAIDLNEAVDRAEESVAAATSSDRSGSTQIADDARVDAAELDALSVMASVVGDLTEGVRGLAVASGIDNADVKPAALLMGELERRGQVSTGLAEAFYATFRPAQTSLLTSTAELSAASRLRRLAYLVLEELNRPDPTEGKPHQ